MVDLKQLIVSEVEFLFEEALKHWQVIDKKDKSLYMDLGFVVLFTKDGNTFTGDSRGYVSDDIEAHKRAYEMALAKMRQHYESGQARQ